MKPPKSPRQFNSTLPARTARLASSKSPARAPMTRTRRTKASFSRIYGSVERVQFVAALNCVVLGCRRGPCENCHSETGGIGRKANAATIFPACPTHHRELHAVGVRTFESLHHLSLAACAAECEAAWQAYQREVAA